MIKSHKGNKFRTQKKELSLSLIPLSKKTIATDKLSKRIIRTDNPL